MPPLVSVVTATRSRPRELRRAFASLRAQTYARWEWIVVDDGSGEDYVTPLADEDERVRPLRLEAAAGKGPVRNRGLDQVTGAWFTFLDDDDELLPDALHILVAAAHDRRFAPHIYRADLLLEDERGRRRPAPRFLRSRDPWVEALFAIGNIAGYLVPAALTDVRFRDTRYFQDGDYFLRLALRTRIVKVSAPVYVYHRYGSSGSAQAYTSRPQEDVLREELDALRGLFRTEHPTIAAYAADGTYDLAQAARYVWHASAFPEVSLRETWRRALSADRRPRVWWWLLRATAIRLLK